jgi:hypothetical protein
MDADDQLLFFVDESLPIREIKAILAGHRIEPVDLQSFDPEILRSAEQQSAIVIVQDKGFLRNLYRFLREDPRCMRRAGVVCLPGEWEKARARLTKYLPLIELLCQIARRQPHDQRLGIDLSQAEIRIKDPF